MTWPEGFVSPPNTAAWRSGFALGDALRAKYAGLPVRIHNDVVALVVGEHWRGAGRGVDDLLGMVVSTGVGGGVVLRGRVVDGRTGNAGHVGHLVVDPDGPACGCGGRGCVEAIARGPATVAWARERGCPARDGRRARGARARRRRGRARGPRAGRAGRSGSASSGLPPSSTCRWCCSAAGCRRPASRCGGRCGRRSPRTRGCPSSPGCAWSRPRSGRTPAWSARRPWCTAGTRTGPPVEEEGDGLSADTRLRYACDSGSAGPSGLDEALAALAGAGLHGGVLSGAHLDEALARPGDLRERLDALCLEVVVDAGPVPVGDDDALQRVRAACDLADALRAEAVVLTVPAGLDGARPDEAGLVEALRALVASHGRAPYALALRPRPGTAVADLDGWGRVRDRVPGLALALHGTSGPEALRAGAPHLRAVVLDDLADPGVPEALRALVGVTYDGLVAVAPGAGRPVAVVDALLAVGG